MTGPVPGGKIFADLLIKGEEADAIALQIEKISQSSGRSIGVFGFGIGKRAVTHRAAIVDQQMAPKVRFVFELLDVITVASCEEPPVKITWIIAGRVLPVFSELDGESMIGAPMNARPESFHDDAGAQLQIFDAHQRARMNERAGSVLKSI